MNLQLTPAMSRFWFGIIEAGLLTVGAITTAFIPAFPFVVFASTLGGLFTIFAASKTFTDRGESKEMTARLCQNGASELVAVLKEVKHE